MKVYIYGDGSANVYKVTSTTIEYNPVKPKYSSSGFYDGGTAVLKDITPVEYAEIGQLMEKALTNKIDHIENRTKGSGSVTIRTASSSTNFILAYGSKTQQELEVVLKRLIGK